MNVLTASSTAVKSKQGNPLSFGSHRVVGKQAKTSVNEGSPSFLIKDLVSNKIDLWKVSDRLNVNPSTVQKILEGNPVSRSVTKKIEAAFQEGRVLDEEAGHAEMSNHSTVERLMEVHALYEEEKSLRTVGKKLGLSRERVRQLLEKGTEIGLFKYKPTKAPLLSREKILKDYGKHLKRSEVARANRISTNYLSKLIAFHHITKADLNAIRLEGGKQRSMKQYQSLAGKLGHHPTTTELQRTKATRSLAFKIRRLWGSLEAFRDTFDFVPGRPVERKNRKDRKQEAVLVGV